MASHYPFAFSYYTTAIPTGDASPNSSAPAQSRIAQPEGLVTPADAVVLWVGDAGSITLSLWYVEAASGEWLALGGSRTVTASGGPVYVSIPAAVPIFAQVASVAGGATKFGIGFTSGGIGASSGAGGGSVSITGSLPAGTNVLGHIIVDSAGNVAVTSLPSLAAGTAVIGHVITDSGTITVSSLPSLPAGSAIIGAVTGGSGAALATDAHLASILALLPAALAGSGSLKILGDDDGSMLTALQTIAGTVSASKMATADASADTSLSALAALIVSSALNVNSLTKIAGEDITDDVMKVEQQFSPAHITTATTTVVKSGAGLLHRVGVNTPVAAATITVYDNTAGSGTVLAVITTPASPVPFSLDYDVKVVNGLTLVTVGAQDITVSYR